MLIIQNALNGRWHSLFVSPIECSNLNKALDRIIQFVLLKLQHSAVAFDKYSGHRRLFHNLIHKSLFLLHFLTEMLFKQEQALSMSNIQWQFINPKNPSLVQKPSFLWHIGNPPVKMTRMEKTQAKMMTSLQKVSLIYRLYSI